MMAQPSSGEHEHGAGGRAKPRRRILSRNGACRSKGERYGDYAKGLAIGITTPAAAQGGKRTGNTCAQGHGSVFHLANRRRERQGGIRRPLWLKKHGRHPCGGSVSQ